MSLGESLQIRGYRLFDCTELKSCFDKSVVMTIAYVYLRLILVDTWILVVSVEVKLLKPSGLVVKEACLLVHFLNHSGFSIVISTDSQV